MAPSCLLPRTLLARACWLATLGAALLLAPPAPAQAPGGQPLDIIVDDFESADLLSTVGSAWTPFYKGDGGAEPIALQIVDSPAGGKELHATGKLADDGSPSTWGGCFVDLSRDGTAQWDLFAHELLTFRARTDEPALYMVRLEGAGLQENALSIPFPVETSGDQVAIPLWRFAPANRRATRLTFFRADQEPGANFSLYLDDVSFETATARAQAELKDSGIAWAPSVTSAWETASARQRPLVMYFTSSIVSRCQEFEAAAIEDGTLKALAEDSVLALVDVSTNLEFARRMNVYRVPRFIAMRPSDRRIATVDPIIDADHWTELQDDVAVFLAANGAAPPEVAGGSSDSGRQGTLIDDFSDMSVINRVGGLWMPFSRGDRGDIAHRFVVTEAKDFALEVFGTIPPAGLDGVTWGGVACELSPRRAAPRDLRYFQNLEFTASTTAPGRYAVRIEGPGGVASALVTLDIGPETRSYSIPLWAFANNVESAAAIVWLLVDPRPGQPFHLVLDDVGFSR